MTRKKTPKKNKKSSKKRQSKLGIVLVIVIIIAALAYFGFHYTKQGVASKGVAATVNDNEITLAELNMKYEKLPEQYKALISEQMFLDQMINVQLLLQGAESQGISVDDEDIEEEFEATKAQFSTMESFDEFLVSGGVTADEFKEQIGEQLMISELLDETIYSKIEISDDEVEDFYDKNGDIINAELDEDIGEQIRDLLFKEKADMALETYISQLRANSEIIYGEKEKIIVNEFVNTESRVCKKEGKPIVIFFSTRKCSTCKWVESAFAKVADKYESQGKIVVSHWELDTGDNLRTEEKEEGVPADALNLFRKYNEKSTVPTFVFGCKYVRVGNTGSNSLDTEEDEFIRVMEKIVE